jgi:response regulator RpfG family c-di-GMP phosphodiesterase
MKIFICEQDISKARSMEAVLGKTSYKVITVNKNQDLFKQVNQQRPAVIIVNQSFTEDFGVDTINRLKNDPLTSNIPIIYIGKPGDLLTDFKSEKHHYVEVVHEPVKIKNLKHYIDRWTTFRSLYVRH